MQQRFRLIFLLIVLLVKCTHRHRTGPDSCDCSRKDKEKHPDSFLLTDRMRENGPRMGSRQQREALRRLGRSQTQRKDCHERRESENKARVSNCPFRSLVQKSREDVDEQMIALERAEYINYDITPLLLCSKIEQKF